MQVRHWDRRGNSGIGFTEMGLGTAPLGNLYRAVPPPDARAVMDAAWEAGVRLFDTAPLYGLGLSETRLNPFLRDHPRDEIVLCTKIGRVLRPATAETREGIGKWFDVPARIGEYDYSHDGVMRSLEFSLERLGVDRIDVVHAHDLDLFTHKRQEVLDDHRAAFMAGAYRALVRLRDEGVIRAFGAGVNEAECCTWLAERGDFDLFLLAGRYTLLEQGALDGFLPLAQARGIGVMLGGVFNSGILATGARRGAFYNYDPAPPGILSRVARIESVCAAHGVTLAEAALRFPLAHPAVVSVVLGAQRPAEVEANAHALATPIPPALWSDLRAEGLLREDAPVPA